MKQTCLVCERTSPDRNLYCQDLRCPAELSPLILDYGEWLGDIEIIRRLVVLPASALYEARQHQKRVLLKIAHPGTERTERLKREVTFLRDHQQQAAKMHLPVLLPPYIDTSIAQNPYGKAVLRGQLLYFCLFEHFDGEPLRDVLKKNPQLWIKHTGWITISLAKAVACMQSQGRLHLAICPDAALLRFDSDAKLDIPQVLLCDLGMVYAPQGNLPYADVVAPAYTAPELLEPSPTQLGNASDVYGLGLTLYEMLVGEPAFPSRQRSDAAIYAAVRRGEIVPMNRVEDVGPVAAIAEQAVSRNPRDRQANAQQLAKDLIKIFADLPVPTRRWWSRWEIILLIVVVLLAIAFAVAVATSIVGLAGFVSLAAYRS